MEMKFKSAYVKKLRIERLWSQDELATASDLSLRTIQRVEREGAGSVETLKSLSSALEVPTQELMLEERLSTYKHTQIGWPILIILVVIFSFISMFVPLQATVLIGIICLAFSTLTIRVDEHELKWFFGPWVFRKKELMSEIESCEIVTNIWWWGYGIRFHPNGQWLYNVSGLNAIEVSLKSGKKFRLGTDEPNYLFNAINDAIKASSE